MKKQLLVNIISATLMLLFLYASLNKLLEYEKFVTQIQQTPVLHDLAKAIAIFIPLIEIIIVILLALPSKQKYGLYSSFFLMLIFTFYVIYVLAFRGHAHCSCGGVLENLTWKSHLIFNSLFLILAAIGILLNQSIKSNSFKQDLPQLSKINSI